MDKVGYNNGCLKDTSLLELAANVKVVVSLSFETRGLPFSSVWGT